MNYEKQIILLMIPNEENEGWHYLAVKKLRGIISKYDGDFCCFSYLHSFRTENKLKSHEKVCKNNFFFYRIIMASQENNISQFNQYMKLDKMSYIIYADICAEHATNILNFKKKEMSLLTKEELKLPQDATNFYI